MGFLVFLIIIIGLLPILLTIGYVIGSEGQSLKQYLPVILICWPVALVLSYRNAKPNCPFCIKRVDPRATVCPHCHTGLAVKKSP